MKVKAYAKINLTLDIVGEKDGYHLLDSFVASVDMYDLVQLKKRKDKLSSVYFKGLDSHLIPPENNALKAAEAFSERFSTTGADIVVYRNIPVGAGLGSSSADIAGVLNGMAKLYGITDKAELAKLAEELGSDTKYMLTGGFARMQGRGEIITPLSSDETLYFLLICPNGGVSAGACYKEYDSMPLTENCCATEACIQAFLKKDKADLGKCLQNALFAPATRLNGDVAKAYEEANSFSPLGAVMTGSGSCIMAFFETRELCEWAQSRYRGKFKTYVVKTVNPAKQKGWKNPFVLDIE